MREFAKATLTVARESAWGTYQYLDLHYDEECEALHYLLKPAPRPCFTIEVLEEIRALQKAVQAVVTVERSRAGQSSLQYLVASSGALDGAHYGGDLEFFLNAVRSGDRPALAEYANLGVEVLYQNYVNLGVGLRTVAILRGKTLGAGLEAALSCDLVVAEKSARMGFPEVIFNMFPGMGAYSFIARRSSPFVAEQMILRGRLQSGIELYENGLVDLLSDDGHGGSTFRRFCASERRRGNTRDALLRIRRIVGPVTRSELHDIAAIWVESSFRLGETNLSMIERLLELQQRKVGGQQRMAVAASSAG